MDVYKLLPNFLAFLGHPAFSGAAIVVGLGLLWRFAKNSEKVSPSVLVHPRTKLPLVHPIYPAFRRAAWACAMAFLAAFTLWCWYKTPVRSYILADTLPIAVVKTPPVPANVLRHGAVHAPSANRQPSSRAPKHTSGVSTPEPTATGDVASGKILPEPLVPSTPNEGNAPAAVNDAHIARSIPTNLIPQDPIAAVQAVEHVRKGLREVLKSKESITFLLSWSKDDTTYYPFISQLLSSACREAPRQCWFTQQGNGRDLDRPPVQGSSKRGITVHGPDANALASVLSNWFETYSTSSLPSELKGYKEHDTRYLIWIDIGPGSPFKQ